MKKFASILILPLHFLQIFTGAKSFEKNRILASRRLNELGLHRARILVAQSMTRWRRRSLGRVLPAELRTQYEKTGYIRVENFLDTQTFAEVRREIEQQNFERYEMRQGPTTTRRSIVDVNTLSNRPGLRKAVNSKLLKDIVCYVASHAGQPLITLQTIFAAPVPEEKSAGDPQTQVHSDTFHATAKAWLFLHDVGPEDGPFSYVEGSHNLTPERVEWENSIAVNISSEENKYSRRGSLRLPVSMLAPLGYAEPKEMTVSANTLIVADTHGFHARCACNKPTQRIEIYASLRRSPFLPWALRPLGGLHLPALPFVANRLTGSIKTTLKLGNRLGLAANPWRKISDGSPQER